MFDSKKYARKKGSESGLLSVGLNFSAGVGLFFYFGYLADNYFEHKFTFKLIGLMFGIFGATVKLLKDVKKLDERE
jgi:F0F1-type ATP synthase assembly protein I